MNYHWTLIDTKISSNHNANLKPDQKIPKTSALLVFTLVVAVSVLSFGWVAAQMTDSDTLDVSAVVGSPAPPGGTGSGSGSSSGATVVMSGWAFPGAKLTLLRDGSVATRLIANPDGSFQITLNGISLGNYQLAIFAEDQDGLLSSPHTINLAANTVQPYNFTNIIIPPTIKVNPTNIGLGQAYVISGYAPVSSSVNAQIPGLVNLGTTTADANGYYQLSLTNSLPPGIQLIRTQAQLFSFTSLFSKPVQVVFYLPGQTPIPPPPAQLGVCVDYNKDRRVNLIDFSILLFWFGKPAAPSTIDCNRDNVIDIKDFSILMYFWTG